MIDPAAQTVIFLPWGVGEPHGLPESLVRGGWYEHAAALLRPIREAGLPCHTIMQPRFAGKPPGPVRFTAAELARRSDDPAIRAVVDRDTVLSDFRRLCGDFPIREVICEIGSPENDRWYMSKVVSGDVSGQLWLEHQSLNLIDDLRKTLATLPDPVAVSLNIDHGSANHPADRRVLDRFRDVMRVSLETVPPIGAIERTDFFMSADAVRSRVARIHYYLESGGRGIVHINRSGPVHEWTLDKLRDAAASIMAVDDRLCIALRAQDMAMLGTARKSIEWLFGECA